MAIKFRKIKTQDKKAVEKLLFQLTGNKIRVNIDSLIKDEGCNCIVMEDSQKIIGFGSLIVHQVPCEGYVARIEDVVIDSAWRGKGHGKRLTKELIAIAKNKKVKKINLTSNPKRITARNLYKNMGFEIYNTGVFKMDL